MPKPYKPFKYTFTDEDGVETERLGKFRLDYNAICDFEAMSGKGIMEILGKFDKEGNMVSSPTITFSDLRTLLFVAMKDKAPQDFKMRDAGIIIECLGLNKATELITEGIMEALPDFKKNKDIKTSDKSVKN